MRVHVISAIKAHQFAWQKRVADARGQETGWVGQSKKKKAVVKHNWREKVPLSFLALRAREYPSCWQSPNPSGGWTTQESIGVKEISAVKLVTKTERFN